MPAFRSAFMSPDYVPVVSQEIYVPDFKIVDVTLESFDTAAPVAEVAVEDQPESDQPVAANPTEPAAAPASTEGE